MSLVGAGKSVRAICIVVSSGMTVNAFLVNHIMSMSKKYQVTLIYNPKDGHEVNLGDNIDTIPVRIERHISPYHDIMALMHLVVVFARGNFDVVHSVTPKAGLLASLAGCMARVQYRIHIFTGQVWKTKVGASRFVLKVIDKLIAYCCTHLLADSPSQRQFIIDSHVSRSDKISVLANGSICGVDVEKFKPDMSVNTEVRERYKIASTDIVFLYLGRMNRDKGIFILLEAFCKLVTGMGNVVLLLVGPDEENIKEHISGLDNNCRDKILLEKYTTSPQDYMSASDIFCLPSYREGFGNVIIEAAASGVPSIGSNIYGISDAIVPGETGYLFEVGNSESLYNHMRMLVSNADLLKSMSDAAQDNAVQNFNSNLVTDAWLGYYESLH